MYPVELILIVEDLEPSATWLAALMRRHFPAAAVAVRGTLAGARAWLRDCPPAAAPLCLIDLGLPDGSGVELIAAISRRLPAAVQIVTTTFDDDRSVLAAMAAGAAGYVLKDDEPDLVAARIVAVGRGEVPMSPAISRRILDSFRARARFELAAVEAALTPREEDTLRLVGRGLRTGEIARTLGLSDNTVSGYLKAVYRKLDIGTRAEAALEASRRNLV